MQNYTRPEGFSEHDLLTATLRDIQEYLMPILLATAQTYNDPIASEQLRDLTDKIKLIGEGLFTTYHFRAFSGDTEKFKNLISPMSPQIQLRLIGIFEMLSSASEIDIAENTIYMIDRLTQLRIEVYQKSNCFN